MNQVYAASRRSRLAHRLIASVRRLWRRSNFVKRVLRPSFDGLESRMVFSLTPVPPNAASPFTAVVVLETTFPNGEAYFGSGFMVDSYHVLTAGHLVYEYDDGGFATTIRVIPDLYGTSEPFGEATMTKERTMPAWQTFSASYPDATGPDSQDIGLITLNRQIGTQSGWMSFGYSRNLSTYNAGSIFDTAGYPADPASGFDGRHMGLSSGPILGLFPGDDAIGYYQSDITTYGGQSGSPFWSNATGVVSGVVTGGLIRSAGARIRPAISDASGLGMATRITPEIYSELRRWIAMDSPPVPPPPPVIPPNATAIGPTWRSRRGITSIGVSFDQALNASSAIKRHQYDVVAVMKRVNGRDVDDARALQIARVAYNRNLHRVRIYLTRPYKGTVKVIVYPGLVGANGAVSAEAYSWVVR